MDVNVSACGSILKQIEVDGTDFYLKKRSQYWKDEQTSHHRLYAQGNR